MGLSLYIYNYNIYIYIHIGSMYGIYANIGGILMVNVTIYSIHGSYGIYIYIFMYLDPPNTPTKTGFDLTVLGLLPFVFCIWRV